MPELKRTLCRNRSDRLLASGPALSVTISWSTEREPSLEVHAASIAVELGDGRYVIAVHGPHPINLAELVTWIDRGHSEFSPVRQGFAAVVFDPKNGSYSATVSSRMEVSLYLHTNKQRTILSSNPGGVVERMRELPPLIADRRALFQDCSLSPFEGVKRIAPGRVATAASGDSPQVVRWFVPESFDRLPRSAPATQLMRDAVVGAVLNSLPPKSDAAVTLSGGLDSTIVAAVAANALGAQGRTLHAFTHVPLAGARSDREGWDTSEEGITRCFADSFASIEHFVHVDPVERNSIDTLAWFFPRAYTPPLNSDNLVWLRSSLDFATDRCSQENPSVLLTGAVGNQTFSQSDSTVVPQLLKQRHYGRASAHALRQLLRHRDGESTRALLHALFPANSRNVEPQVRLPWPNDLVNPPAHVTAFQSPLANIWWSDPLGDQEVVALAMTLPPEARSPSGVDRGLARAVGRDLVPDSVRLRHVRGTQAVDSPIRVRESWDKYREALDQIRSSSSACAWIDVDSLTEQFDRGAPSGMAPSAQWIVHTSRAIAFGLFALWWDQKLREGGQLRRAAD